MKTSFLVCLFSFLTFFGYSEKCSCTKKMSDLCLEQASQERTTSRQRPPAQAATPSSDRNTDREAFQRRVQAQRVAYFTKKLALTPAEAERFWPLYNTYQNERERLINETNQRTRVRRNPDEQPEFDVSNMSDAEARRLVGNKAKQIELERKFHDDLTKMFSPQRVLAFYDAERSFQRELINARNRGGSGREGGGREGGGDGRERTR